MLFRFLQLVSQCYQIPVEVAVTRDTIRTNRDFDYTIIIVDRFYFTFIESYNCHFYMKVNC